MRHPEINMREPGPGMHQPIRTRWVKRLSCRIARRGFLGRGEDLVLLWMRNFWPGVLFIVMHVSAGPVSAQRFPHGTLPILTQAEAATLRDNLANASDDAQWDAVLAQYFGTLYDSSLVDLVVYIPSGDSVRQALIYDGQVETRLDGAKFVYALIFTDVAPRRIQGAAMTAGTTAAADHDVVVSLAALDYQKDRFLAALVKGIAGKLGASLETKAPQASDSSVSLRFEPVTGNASSSPLFVAMTRFPLAERTTNRISLRPAAGRSNFPRDRSIYYNFGNASGSRFGVSLAGGITIAARRETVEDVGDTTQTVKQGAYLRTAIYLLGHIHIDRADLPWDQFSFSVTGGTNLSNGDLLDDLVGGLTFGRVGDMGFMVGGNLFQTEKLERSGGTQTIKRTWKLRPFFAIDFAL